MTKIQEILDFAREYVWLNLIPEKKTKPANEQKLHGALQYKLCEASDRLLASFGEVTKKDIAMLVEAWVLAQGTTRPAKPLEVMEQNIYG